MNNHLQIIVLLEKSLSDYRGNLQYNQLDTHCSSACNGDPFVQGLLSNGSSDHPYGSLAGTKVEIVKE